MDERSLRLNGVRYSPERLCCICMHSRRVVAYGMLSFEYWPCCKIQCRIKNGRQNLLVYILFLKPCWITHQCTTEAATLQWHQTPSAPTGRLKPKAVRSEMKWGSKGFNRKYSLTVWLKWGHLEFYWTWFWSWFISSKQKQTKRRQTSKQIYR